MHARPDDARLAASMSAHGRGQPWPRRRALPCPARAQTFTGPVSFEVIQRKLDSMMAPTVLVEPPVVKPVPLAPPRRRRFYDNDDDDDDAAEAEEEAREKQARRSPLRVEPAVRAMEGLLPVLGDAETGSEESDDERSESGSSDRQDSADEADRGGSRVLPGSANATPTRSSRRLRFSSRPTVIDEFERELSAGVLQLAARGAPAAAGAAAQAGSLPSPATSAHEQQRDGAAARRADEGAAQPAVDTIDDAAASTASREGKESNGAAAALTQQLDARGDESSAASAARPTTSMFRSHWKVDVGP